MRRPFQMLLARTLASCVVTGALVVPMTALASPAAGTGTPATGKQRPADAPVPPGIADAPEIDPARTQTLERMKSWKPWYGQWEGTLFVERADSKARELPLRLSMSPDLVVLETRGPKGDWEEIDCLYQAMAPTPVSATVTFHRAGGRWVETMQLAMTRVTGDAAQVWLMRTVNNWNGKPPAGVDPLFAVMRTGMFKRIGPAKEKPVQSERPPA